MGAGEKFSTLLVRDRDYLRVEDALVDLPRYGQLMGGALRHQQVAELDNEVVRADSALEMGVERNGALFAGRQTGVDTFFMWGMSLEVAGQRDVLLHEELARLIGER